MQHKHFWTQNCTKWKVYDSACLSSNLTNTNGHVYKSDMNKCTFSSGLNPSTNLVFIWIQESKILNPARSANLFSKVQNTNFMNYMKSSANQKIWTIPMMHMTHSALQIFPCVLFCQFCEHLYASPCCNIFCILLFCLMFLLFLFLYVILDSSSVLCSNAFKKTRSTFEIWADEITGLGDLLNICNMQRFQM